MERRHFLSWVSVGFLASYLPVSLAACNSNEELPTPKEASPSPSSEDIDHNISPQDGFVLVGSVEQLREKGAIFKEKLELVVVRNPENNGLVALNPMCTHQGCTVKWEARGGNLVCPCHDSVFA
ncbi:MAG: Rieske (2Fe-2S) protein, partial [Okeania sp. SIO2D1]|nr:Rieske (2Fe-2S) protein [Okeania sp. SIO2D1]